jgi:hypothetical protein
LEDDDDDGVTEFVRENVPRFYGKKEKKSMEQSIILY